MGADGSCAIVGGGLAGFVAYATLRHGGLEPGEIAVFDTDPDPVAAWRPRAEAIRQRRMRSESDGHCHPRSFPGLAPRETVRTGSLAPLVRTVCNRYRPTVEEFLRHVTELRDGSGWDESVRRHRVLRVQATEDGFDIDGEGRFRHVLVAPGHPGLAFPTELADDPRTVHAYEPHAYAERVAVVGAGMAAATEWLNALAAGAEVVSVRRREPQRRPLNVHARSSPGEVSLPTTLPAEGSAPTSWLALASPPTPRGASGTSRSSSRSAKGDSVLPRRVDGEPQIVCATGFRRGFEHDTVLRRLVEEHGLHTEGRWVVLAPDATVPALTDATRTLALSGPPAQWAYPAADTLVGMKYVARRFLRRVKACRTR